MAVREASAAWPLLAAEYRKAPIGKENGIRLGAKDGLAAAVSATATDAVIGQLVLRAKDVSNGESRVLPLSAIRKSKTAFAKSVPEELADDPDLRKEIPSWKKVRKSRSSEVLTAARSRILADLDPKPVGDDEFHAMLQGSTMS